MNKPSQERIERAAEAMNYRAIQIPYDLRNHTPKRFYIEMATSVLTADDSHLAAENAELRAEIDEQCRIIGISGEREARHLAEIERLRKLLGEAEGALEFYARDTKESWQAMREFMDDCENGHQIAKQTLTKIRAELSGENRGGE